MKNTFVELTYHNMGHKHVQIFYYFNLLQQMFPAGSAEVIFCHVSKNDKKQKESPHSFFIECELSFFI